MSFIRQNIKRILSRNKYLARHEATKSLRAKVATQFIIALSFLFLSITNVFTESYIMLGFTGAGCLINAVFAAIALGKGNSKYCIYPSIISCALLFSLFVITGGNDGFAALWIALTPIFAMGIMDLLIGFFMSVLMQIFLIIVFWTPIKTVLPYQYNEQFCLRFPIFFFVAMILGFVMTIILQRNQYEAHAQAHRLEKISEDATRMAKHDYLTGLPNRRYAYEMFEKSFRGDIAVHCVIMSDIDGFKSLNDTYGHEFGDEVLQTLARMFNQYLPEDYMKARWGGEEFLFAANAPKRIVFKNIEFLRKKIEAQEFICQGKRIKVTMTFGIAEYYSGSALNDAINMADSRMYTGKRTTKNCTVMD